MSVAHYTTEVEVEKTAEDIRKLLRKWKAQEIGETYDKEGRLTGVKFLMNGMWYRFDARHDKILVNIQRDPNVPGKYCNERQARRIAWRILWGWLKYQMEIAETGLMDNEQILMPYRLGKAGATMWEVYRNQNFMLELKE